MVVWSEQTEVTLTKDKKHEATAEASSTVKISYVNGKVISQTKQDAAHQNQDTSCKVTWL